MMSDRDNRIPVAKPFIGEAEADAVRRVLLSGWVTQGPEVAAFEREFAEYVGAGHACAVTSCTTALHLSLLVAGVSPGDEVITASHSFIATANSIRYCGAVPVFVDINRETFNIEPSSVEAAITERTKAILCVHQMGMPCDIVALASVGKTHGIPVIEDAACALGSEVCADDSWERIGKPRGDAACFSFHPRKMLTTGDGGMITTRHASWGRKLKLLRQHGMSVPDTLRHNANDVICEEYVGLGYNYRMTDIHAAIGRVQLKRLPELVAQRRLQVSRYEELLSNVAEIELPTEPSWARTNWQSCCIKLADNVDQRTIMQRMLDDGISTRRGIMCSHREPACSDCEQRFPLTASEEAQDHCIILPLYHDMDEKDQERVIDALIAALNQS